MLYKITHLFTKLHFGLESFAFYRCFLQKFSYLCSTNEDEKPAEQRRGNSLVPPSYLPVKSPLNGEKRDGNA